MSVVGITKCYGPFVAVQDVSFTLAGDQVVAMLGPNGAGKTTTLKILTGYIAPDAGTVAISGANVQNNRVAALREIGYLPENGPLYPDLTPAQLLGFFGEARGLLGTPLRHRIAEVATVCDLHPILHKRIGGLSKGMRQRVGIAQAILHDPKVLILDEPTSGLDPHQVVQFRRLIRDLRSTRTIIISTHMLREVGAVADRLIILNQGRLAFDGELPSTCDAPTLEELFFRLTANPQDANELAASAFPTH